MSNVIPLGARASRTLPIPLADDYRALIYNAMSLHDIDISAIELMSEQHWLLFTNYLSHLSDDKTLEPLWMELGVTPGLDIYPSLLQFALYMRFACLRGRIYETSPAVEQVAEQLGCQDVRLSDLDLVTGKPVYFHLAPNSPLRFTINDNETNRVVGAYLQYEETDEGKILYYLIHDKSSTWNTLSGHIYLNSGSVNLAQLSEGLFTHVGSNKQCFEHMMKIWSLWSTHKLSEHHYQEHDMIAANGHPTQQRRLQGAYNRIMLDMK